VNDWVEQNPIGNAFRTTSSHSALSSASSNLAQSRLSAASGYCCSCWRGLCQKPAINRIKERETNDIPSNSPQAARQKTTSKASHSQNHLPLNSSMDSFFTLFTLYPAEPETAPETSTPIEALDGGPQYCVVA
jgi:hypothetical protein